MKYIALILMFPMVAFAGGYKEEPKCETTVAPVVQPVETPVVTPPVVVSSPSTPKSSSSKSGGHRHSINNSSLQLQQLELIKQVLVLMKLKLYTLPSSVSQGKG